MYCLASSLDEYSLIEFVKFVSVSHVMCDQWMVYFYIIVTYFHMSMVHSHHSDIKYALDKS